MPAKESAQTSAIDRVRNSYRKLNTVAKDLNTASDEFKQAVSVLDAALERLNLGIVSWVRISGSEDDDCNWWCREIGYARIGKKWGIAIRNSSGNHNWPDQDSEEQWPFADAPRWMRLEAVAKIPDLLDGLVKQAADTTEKLKKRTVQVLELATAMSQAVDESTPVSPFGGGRDWGSGPAVTQSVPNAPIAAPETEGALDAESLRNAVTAALAGGGHGSAAQLMRTGTWTFEGATVRIEVPGIGKKMLALTVNAGAEKIVRQELQRQGAPTRFLVVPGAGTANEGGSNV